MADTVLHRLGLNAPLKTLRYRRGMPAQQTRPHTSRTVCALSESGAIAGLLWGRQAACNHTCRLARVQGRSPWAGRRRTGRKHVVARRHGAHGLDAAGVPVEGADAPCAQRVPQRHALVA